ncbi:hypothetical protein RC94_11390 [Pectobacterium brasiliense]|uniref:hypothetical protein n=1 Tax=Pectobacterium brasiliense TaxID=180957 RepID=UPI00057DA6A3|nr:hypothetical protein [Pectobacterium brasiliense]KHS75860.1 hypothetical protein RC79_04460 [Pectobacterium brasiliense]KHT09386.1 hypothetical protein RC92_04430 [Pectobacterium brasiliense]KHT11435.1 hypothetical protein RC94_11390 [Pectobacterium brasiliense]KHT43704.1 hypothetical protein RD02_02850 [Pectobacterium brasiliense]
MSFYKDKVLIENIRETNGYIKINILRQSTESETIDAKSALNRIDYYIDSVLYDAWEYFMTLIDNQITSLDENTKYNQQMIPNKIKFNVNDLKENKLGFLSYLLRLIYEYCFWVGVDDNTPHFINKKTLNNLEIVSHEIKSPNADHFQWIRDSLPIALAKWTISSSEFKEAKNVISKFGSEKESVIDDIKELKYKYESDMNVQYGGLKNELENKRDNIISSIENEYSLTLKKIKNSEQEVDKSVSKIIAGENELKALEERIKGLRTEYDFVGLSSGFDRIKIKKENELRNSEVVYKNIFGCLFLAPVAAFLAHFIKPGVYPENFSAIFVLFPLITIELVLIYFFRLSYLESKSIRTQLLQIELRLSLCAFIQNYVDYRKDHGKNISKLLDSFDSLIFSPIQVNDNNIPSMFDGADAIADLAGKIMKK